MRRRIGAAALIAAGVLGLSACAANGLDVGNTKAVRSAVTDVAKSVDSSVVAKLVLYRTETGAGSATVSVMDERGTVTTRAIEDASGTGMAKTAIPGIPLSELPFADLTGAIKRAEPKCKDRGSAASVTTTRTGKVFLESYCIGRKLADEVRQEQLLAGKQLPKLDSLTSEPALSTILGEARTVIGDQVTSFTINAQKIGDFEPLIDIEAPQASGFAESCTTSYVRTQTLLRYSPACGSVKPPTDIAVTLSDLSAPALAEAIRTATKAAGEGDLMTVALGRMPSGALEVTVVTSKGTGKAAF